MASPFGFNDPYDCALCFHHDAIFNAKQKLESRIGLPSDYKTHIQQMTSLEVNSMIENITNVAVSLAQEDFINTSGITCFSEIKDEPLMWAHYSNKYKGFCLEFHTGIFPFVSKLKRVNYKAEFPVINGLTLLTGEDSDQFLNLMTTKSLSWSYEKEWRLLHNKAGTLYKYPIESLKAIYLGPRTDPILKETIQLIIKQLNPSIEIWQGVISKKEFKIDFVRV
ncbi:MAG: DUF2971 domain-containing protein [Bacteroidia bacterium]